MGVLDKIKNALFEVEYVEVEEPPKKEKKEKVKKVKEKRVKEEKPIAKKVVLPGKREEKVEELHEEELRDEDFEIRPKDEQVKAKEEFKLMDDDDFKVDDEDYISEEPEIVEVEEKVEVKREVPRETRVSREEKVEEYNYVPEKPVYSTPRESKPYGMDNSYNVPVHEYGTYERKEEKAYFRPSPIISPIYGILDKNYKKEDVREKKDVRITTSYTRTNVSVDDIRNKAYGRRSQKEEDFDDDYTKFEVEEQDDDLLVDLSDRSKPEVKELTMGDAEEYFEDLGLEYNVDYVDVSTDRSTTPKKEEKVKEEKPKHEEKKEEVVEDVDEAIKKLHETKKLEPITEEVVVEEDIYEEPVKEVVEDASKDADTDDDNLFDLIDSMYEE